MRVANQWLGMAVLATIFTAGPAWGEGEKVRQVIPFDDNWKFSGPVSAQLAGAELPAFPDGQWRQLNLPHDWGIEGKPESGNPAGPAGAYLPAGLAWYRKAFTLPASAAGKHVFVEFDGIMQNSTVWIDGTQIGERPYGYATVRYDLTGKLAGNGPASQDVLAVKIDNALQPSSRWYAGSGINRHVRLIVTDAVNVEQGGTFITTPKVSAQSATVHVATSIVNQSNAARDVAVEVEVVGPDGKSVSVTKISGQSVEPGKSAAFAGDLEVANPQLWGFETPSLYKALVRVRTGGNVIDDEVTTFGIRSFEFQPDTGFWINGTNVKLYGVCLHEDGGGIGAAVPMGVWERRLKLLKSLGVNAIRTSHNAPNPAFLDLCDRMGFAVMHELFDCWTVRKTPGDYARFFNDWWERDLTDTLVRDRNHPSIVIYSAGNEIHDSQDKQKEILPKLIAVYHKIDPTRPVTQALFRPENPGGAYTNGIAAMLDVVGTNYRPAALTQYRKQHPEAKIIGTEDNYGAPELPTLRNSPDLAGEMTWTGVDYLGEGRQPPSISQGFGLIDRTNTIRFRGYEREAWWAANPMLKMARVLATGRTTNDIGGGRAMDWSPESTDAHNENVEVQSNCQEVELFLNGQSLGRKSRPANWAVRSWQVPFAVGTLKAVGTNKGVEAATDELRTAGKPTKVRLTIDQPKLSPAWDDVCYVRAELVDENGVVNPNADMPITFMLEGPGVIAAVDNADLDSHEAFRGNQRSTWRGSCIAIIKATGNSGPISISAKAEGLAAGTSQIQTVASH